MDLHRRCRTGTKLCAVLRIRRCGSDGVRRSRNQLGWPTLVADDGARPARVANRTCKYACDGGDVGARSTTADGRLAQRFLPADDDPGRPANAAGRAHGTGRKNAQRSAVRRGTVADLVSFKQQCVPPRRRSRRPACTASAIAPRRLRASATRLFAVANVAFENFDPSRQHAMQHGSRMKSVDSQDNP